MSTKKLVYMAIFIALGLILPIGFHYFIPGSGTAFSPMHLPVFLAGAITGPMAGLIVGLVTPVLSSIITGMPPVLPMLPIMAVELPIYGLLIGYLYYSRKFNIYPSLLISMVSGRIAIGFVVWVMVHLFHVSNLPINPAIFVWGSIINGIPGIIIQLIFIPILVRYLKGYRRNVMREERF